MTEEKKNRKPMGGAREGAGRKPKGGVGSQLISCRINREHLEIIKYLVEKGEVKSVAEFIDKAVKDKLRRAELI
jgi:hypothetical protein